MQGSLQGQVHFRVKRENNVKQNPKKSESRTDSREGPNSISIPLRCFPSAIGWTDFASYLIQARFIFRI